MSIGQCPINPRNNNWLCLQPTSRFFNYLEVSPLPKKLLLILHESPGARFSLIPGDFHSPGTKVVEVPFEEMTMIGIDKSIKRLNVQKAKGLCREYARDDSQVLKIIISKNSKAKKENHLKIKTKDSFFPYLLLIIRTSSSIYFRIISLFFLKSIEGRFC